jgi:hypothetical protein
MTRTEAILHAIRRRLDARRVELDAAKDLRGFVIDLKFSPGEETLLPREVVDRIERGEKRAS